jgi:hypothetical protein
MKKPAAALMFSIFGLLSTWVSFLFLERIYTLLPRRVTHNECGDIGQCDLSTLDLAKLLFILFTPLVVHVILGIRINSGNIDIRKLLILASISITGTAIFHVICALLLAN